MADFILYEHVGAVARLTINRPGNGNLLTLNMIGELARHIRSASAAQSTKVIVLESAGSDFSRGRDPSGNPEAATALQVRDELIRPILDLYTAIAEAEPPVLAIVQGPALGLGCALATVADLTLAADTARFRLPEMEKNLPPTLAISAMMSRVPRKGLAHLVYAMNEINAHEALALGLVGSVVPMAELPDARDRLLALLTARSRAALCAVKDYMRSALAMDARGASDYAAALLASVLSSTGR